MSERDRAQRSPGAALRPTRLGAALLLLAVLGVGLIYVLGTAGCGVPGFPLDDAWIHQTYARSLAQSGRFAFGPGEVSTGSTAPLWTLLLALGRLVRAPVVAWSHVLGATSWALTAWTAARLARRLYPAQPIAAPWVAAACLFEWHLAWAAFSGMETMLFTWLSLLLLERCAARSHPALLGLVGGLLFLTRPDGAVLVALVFLFILVDRLFVQDGAKGAQGRRLAWTAVAFAAGLALLVLPYLAFNAAASGQLLPNTFYAKQAEYGSLLQAPLYLRLWRVLRPTLVGGQILLVPGALLGLVYSVRSHRAPPRRATLSQRVLQLLPALWWAAYVGIYALRLPVDYQHGRYVMPTIPLLLLYGVAGTGRLLRPHAARMGVRVVSRALPAAALCAALVFLALGRQAYVQDVCVIDGEMVRAAQWVAAHTPADALIAAHDIGAIGYFSGRSLIDLAGLVTPEVIPYLGDEARLQAYVLAQGADYLVAFPSWYPEMTRDPHFVRVYETNLLLTRQLGGDNMAVYAIR